MNPVAEIFSQGEEVVMGQVVNSNAAWLSQKLSALGFDVRRHSAVGDRLADLKALLLEIAVRADCCICTGGLGPTVDDLTSQAVAEAFGRPLLMDEEALAQIQHYFSSRQREMVDANRKQALLPKGAVRIDNHWGTAPGFSLRFDRCRFFFLPGVPYEMKQMFNGGISKDLLQQFSLRPDTLVTLRSIGLGESDLQQKLTPLQLPEDVQLGFRTGADEIQIKLLFPAGFDPKRMHACVYQVVARIGDTVFAVDGLDRRRGGLVDVIGEFMLDKNYSLALLETASQGLIAAKCVGQDWLMASRYRNSLASLADELQVAINQDDWQQTVSDCAEQLRRRERTDLALVQLYDGGVEQYRDQDQTIILYNALLTPDGLYQSRHSVGGPQQRKQNQAAMLALDLLRRFLQNKCL